VARKWWQEAGVRRQEAGSQDMCRRCTWAKLCSRFLVLLLVASYVMGCDAAWRQLQKLCKCWVATLGALVENSNIRATIHLEHYRVFHSTMRCPCRQLSRHKSFTNAQACHMPLNSPPYPLELPLMCISWTGCVRKASNSLPTDEVHCRKFLLCVTQAKDACHMWQRGLCKLQLIV